MPYPTAAGYPQLSGTYIPQLYAKQLLVYFYMATVFAAIANTNYEGEISKKGDKVNIRTLPEIVVNDYVKGAGLDYQQPDPGNVELDIDSGKYWAFAVNKVDVRQSDIDYVKQWAEHASKTLKINVDRDILSLLYTQAAASNQGALAGLKSKSINLGAVGAPLLMNPTNILNAIVDAGTILDEQSVPEQDRWIVLPPWLTGMIKKSDLRVAALTGDAVSPMRNGKIGMIDRFMIYASNQLPTGLDSQTPVTHVVFGQKEGLTFASQMVENELIPNPSDFGTLMRGLQVYGHKVTKPEAIGHLYVGKDTSWVPANSTL
jgi:hypothetical protein